MSRSFALLSSLLAIATLTVEAQKLWLDQYLAPCAKGAAHYYREPAGEVGTLYLGHTRALDGTLKAEGSYQDAQLLIPHGRFTFYYADGKVESMGDYEMGNKDGAWARYDKWGQELAEKVYDAKALNNIAYTMAKSMPQFPGGDVAMVKAVKAKVGKQPSGALASFVVERDGTVSELNVTGTDDLSAQEVASVISGSRWAAGHNDGLPVRVRMRVPLR